MIQIKDIEKLGLLYLGEEENGEPVLFQSKNLTTHALIVGMTGSGKTGLGIDLLEEAAIDHIPALIIDPKGDMADLLLAFPHLSKEEFAPWTDKPEEEAGKWIGGLKKWGMDETRIQRLIESREAVIYTPASTMGRPISVLGSFEPPTEGADEAALALTSSLLSLLGVKADPLTSREHILISTIIQACWSKNEPIDVARLIKEVQNPPMPRIGALDMDAFYPAKERMNLAITLNNLLASPRFQQWREGEPLDIERLLYTPQGKAKQSIFSLNHLGDNERMFFVTLLLNQLISWMRKQEGTSSLRALLYMDEIFGFFPPTAAPPSKGPMLTLLKTARAFGVGVVLSTQNPADLDYKGLANCGTWFIGKLQTERDRQRLLDGLTAASQERFDQSLLNSLGNRHFLLHSVYEPKPTLFETRWSLSYLKGPLTLAQIATLTERAPTKETAPTKTAHEERASGPPDVKVLYMPSPQKSIYRPYLLASVKLHFQQKDGIDLFEERQIAYRANPDGQDIDLDHPLTTESALSDEPPKDGQFEELPSCLLRQKNYDDFKKRIADKVYLTETYTIYSFKELKLLSKSHESQSAFLGRVSLALREKREAAIEKIRTKMQGKIAALERKLNAASLQIQSGEEADSSKTQETVLSVGSTVLDALLNRGRGLSKAGDIVKRASKIGKESAKTAQAKERYRLLDEELSALKSEMERQIGEIPPIPETSHIPIETLQVRPNRRDITVSRLALLYSPTSLEEIST